MFNPAAIRADGVTRLLLRVQTRGRDTVALFADGRDGVSFKVRPREVRLRGLGRAGLDPYHVYDYRLTSIEGEVLAVVALDLDEGCRLATARLRTDDDFDLIGVDGEHARNGVLFPERVGGRYLRLDRPNRSRLAGGVESGDTIRLCESTDLVDWRPVADVMHGRRRYWDELIGSGPPPIKTREGWLHVYHGVATHFAAANVYQAGVCLLDLDDPSRLVARGRNNILEPRRSWELTGQVPNVVFPTGITVDALDADGYARPDGNVRLYYGAADTCVGLAETSVASLIDACHVER